MAYKGMQEFISVLEKNSELHRINTFVDPVLEITDVTDRVTKSGGKALLFENTGTAFPLLINAFGSDRRMSLAMGRKNISEAFLEINSLFEALTGLEGPATKKLKALPRLLKIPSFLPKRSRRKGACQKHVIKDPDLGILPVLKCWPHDGGRFITLPMVHTIHPETGKPNLGMYRMQVLGRNTTGMHWQRHKTGASHYDAWKITGRKMPVTVTLGGDPVYTYCATAPLPENIDEYILAGFLRKKRVKLVKCLTNDLYVPCDADIVIEGFVDTMQDTVTEGPFGDHTGFYSLADKYPVFHVSCITYRDKAVYPATIVGVPPQEDAIFTRTTEKIFLAPIRIAIQPEITDLHMPDAGIAHNLVIVSINKTYPGQGLKVIGALSGAGQMMFTKYIVVVSGDVDIRNYRELMKQMLDNTDLGSDLVFTKGPLDVLDHSSDTFSFGGKLAVDATIKFPEELSARKQYSQSGNPPLSPSPILPFSPSLPVKSYNEELIKDGIQLLIVSLDPSEEPGSFEKLRSRLTESGITGKARLVIAVDHTVDLNDLFMVAWQVLANSDPVRDSRFISQDLLLIDGTIKYFGIKEFPRHWPNVVCTNIDTIKSVDEKWNLMDFEEFIPSPSLKYRQLLRNGADEIIP